MAKGKICDGALRRVRVGRGDGWRVWTGLLGCCSCGSAQDAGVSRAVAEAEERKSYELCMRSVSGANRRRETKRNVLYEVMVEERSRRKENTGCFLRGS